jgi:hypothetical protein
MGARKSLGLNSAAALLGISAPLLVYRVKAGKIAAWRRRPTYRFSAAVLLAARERNFARKDPRGRRPQLSRVLEGALS